MKSTNLRMPPDVYEQIIALSKGTGIPLNSAILQCMRGIFDLINADPKEPQPLPRVVELGRVARQHDLLEAKLDALIQDQESRVKGWEEDRDQIFRAAKEEKASPELLQVLKSLDKRMKETRQMLDQIRSSDNKR